MTRPGHPIPKCGIFLTGSLTLLFCQCEVQCELSITDEEKQAAAAGGRRQFLTGQQTLPGIALLLPRLLRQ